MIEPRVVSNSEGRGGTEAAKYTALSRSSNSLGYIWTGNAYALVEGNVFQ